MIIAALSSATTAYPGAAFHWDARLKRTGQTVKLIRFQEPPAITASRVNGGRLIKFAVKINEKVYNTLTGMFGK